MKVIATLAALLIGTLATPAFADWDMGSSNTPSSQSVQQFEQHANQMVAAANTNTTNGGMQWDTTAIQNTNAAAVAAVAESNYLQQLALQQQQQRNATPNYITSNANYGTPNLPVCQTALMSPGGLPQTSLDSFVADAGGNADQIYGDEGTTDIPPLFGFSSGNTINSGIKSKLTTGHASGLPSAWTSYY
jgi:hypothetical protein